MPHPLLKLAPSFRPETHRSRALRPSLLELVEAGKLTEIVADSGAARTTTAMAIVRHVQAAQEPVVWVSADDHRLFAPDVLAAGLDLDAFVVVRTPEAQGPAALVRASEILLRSGGFGLVVLDFEHRWPRGSASVWQAKLLGLARMHGVRVVLLGPRAGSASEGALVSLRIAPRRASSVEDDAAITVEVRKSRRDGGDECAPLSCRRPAGWR